MLNALVDPRNPFLVLVWAFGLFLLMHAHQYLGALLAARADHVSFDSLMSGEHVSPRSLLLRGTVAIVIGIPLIWLCSTLLWNRPAVWMGVSLHWGWLLLGIGLGMVSPLLIVFVLWRMNLARVLLARLGMGRVELISAILGTTFLVVFAGVSEEIVFRGMMGLEISVAWGWPAAILISGAMFGIVHLLAQMKTLTLRKAGAIMVSSLAVSFLFVSLYRFSHSLWLPIGFHIAWNYAHSVLLGLEMNDEAPLASCLQTTLDKRSWITGGNAGMEASLPSVSWYLLLGLVFTLLR